MTQFQIGDFKEIVGGIPKVSCDIHRTIKHAYLIALKTNTAEMAHEVKEGILQRLLLVPPLRELLITGFHRC